MQEGPEVSQAGPGGLILGRCGGGAVGTSPSGVLLVGGGRGVPPGNNCGGGMGGLSVHGPDCRF